MTDVGLSRNVQATPVGEAIHVFRRPHAADAWVGGVPPCGARSQQTMLCNVCLAFGGKTRANVNKLRLRPRPIDTGTNNVNALDDNPRRSFPISMPVSVIFRTLGLWNRAGGVTLPLNLWMRRCHFGCLQQPQLSMVWKTKSNDLC